MSVFLDAQRPVTGDRSTAASLRLTAAPRRRPGLIVGSLMLMTMCAALFSNAYLRARHQVPVLAVARPVPQGATVHATDLTVVRIAASGRLSPVAAADAGQVVGRRAAVALVPGSLLTIREVSTAPVVPAGGAIVGVAVKAGQLPADGLDPGQAVDVVLTGVPGAPASASPSVSSSLAGSATDPGGTPAPGTDPLTTLAGVVVASHVLVTASSPGTAANGGSTDVSLLVPTGVAPVVASASAAGQVALVAVAPAP